jgi:hypothetical protein
VTFFNGTTMRRPERLPTVGQAFEPDACRVSLERLTYDKWCQGRKAGGLGPSLPRATDIEKRDRAGVRSRPGNTGATVEGPIGTVRLRDRTAWPGLPYTCGTTAELPRK